MKRIASKILVQNEFFVEMKLIAKATSFAKRFIEANEGHSVAEAAVKSPS